MSNVSYCYQSGVLVIKAVEEAIIAALLPYIAIYSA